MKKSLSEVVRTVVPPGGIELKMIQDPGSFALEGLSAAIAFVLAPWSSTSLIALRALGKALTEEGVGVPLIVLDIDSFKPDDWARLGQGLPQGNGEAFWIKDGRVVHSMDSFSEKDSLVVRKFVRQIAG